MPFALLILVTFIYAWVSASFALSRQWPLAIMYGGYALANIGPIMLVNR